MKPRLKPLNLSIGRRAVVHFGDFTVGVLHDQGKPFGLVTIILREHGRFIKCQVGSCRREHGFGWQEINNKAQRGADQDIIKFSDGVDLVLVRPIVPISNLELGIATSINFDTILEQLEVLCAGEL